MSAPAWPGVLIEYADDAELVELSGDDVDALEAQRTALGLVGLELPGAFIGTTLIDGEEAKAIAVAPEAGGLRDRTAAIAELYGALEALADGT